MKPFVLFAHCPVFYCHFCPIWGLRGQETTGETLTATRKDRYGISTIIFPSQDEGICVLLRKSQGFLRKCQQPPGWKSTDFFPLRQMIPVSRMYLYPCTPFKFACHRKGVPSDMLRVSPPRHSQTLSAALRRLCGNSQSPQHPNPQYLLIGGGQTCNN